MAQVYIVKQGDHLSRIARQFGFGNFELVWNHAENAALREQRESPNVLLPGDAVFIPDKQLRTERRPTGHRHIFTAQRQRLALAIRLLDIDEQPLTDLACEISIDSARQRLHTDGGGRLEFEIPAESIGGLLRIDDPQRPFVELGFELMVGHLDPVDAFSGQLARLNNLGYFAGEFGATSDDETTPTFRSALEEFQCDHGLAVDGRCGPQTQARLRGVHGS